MFLDRLKMRLQAEGAEDYTQSTEHECGLSQVAQESPCALTSKTKRPQPVQADNDADNEDIPINADIARKLKGRLL